MFTDVILPSISSAKLRIIGLHVDSYAKPYDPQIFKVFDEHLCRLAKRFKAAEGGRKMVVKIIIHENREMFAVFTDQDKPPLPRLSEEAEVEVNHTECYRCQDRIDPTL